MKIKTFMLEKSQIAYMPSGVEVPVCYKGLRQVFTVLPESIKNAPDTLWLQISSEAVNEDSVQLFFYDVYWWFEPQKPVKNSFEHHVASVHRNDFVVTSTSQDAVIKEVLELDSSRHSNTPVFFTLWEPV